jgi:nitrile hydratase accessory protein
LRQPEAEIAAASPALPRDENGPVFAAPWQAQAFALAVHLLERGRLTPGEWATALGAELAAADPRDSPEDYFRHWLDALERLASAKAFASGDEIVSRQQAWRDAAAATPHGRPIVLGRNQVKA